MRLKDKFEEAKMYTRVTGKSEVTFKLTLGEIEEVKKKLKGYSIAQFKWMIRANMEWIK